MRIDDVFLSTGLTISDIPSTSDVQVSLDLFNIDMDTKYALKIKLNDNTVFFSTVNIISDNLLFKTDNGGKVNLQFPFSFTVEKTGDMVITFELWDKEQEIVLDSFVKYVCFEVKNTDERYN